jgi:glycine/D-amino acid oxidase-like deaminating enzyme
MSPHDRYDCLIIGGGFFGLYIAHFLGQRFPKILVCEKDNDVMGRASFANQARVHSGYHYPRSILTALRSRISFPRFVREFEDCIEYSFEKYYAVGRILSKVSARQFQEFCRRIGAPCEPAPEKIRVLFEDQFVEAVFLTREYAFDAERLKKSMIARLRDAGIDVQVACFVERVKKRTEGGIAVVIQRKEESRCVIADRVINCTYSQINQVNQASGLPLIPLKHELTEMALVKMPDELQGISVTVMCGPFFSFMPFPPKPGLYTFSHVRYTPHFEWTDEEADKYINAHELFEATKKKSSWPHMQRDAMRYMPILSNCHYVDSIWEVKTVLPLSEIDDSRPILLKPNYEIPGYYCVLGGKIDQVYDATAALSVEME